jgi:hypothetical protein
MKLATSGAIKRFSSSAAEQRAGAVVHEVSDRAAKHGDEPMDALR